MKRVAILTLLDKRLRELEGSKIELDTIELASKFEPAVIKAVALSSFVRSYMVLEALENYNQTS